MLSLGGPVRNIRPWPEVGTNNTQSAVQRELPLLSVPLVVETMV
jgi:hypothetical protein